MHAGRHGVMTSVLVGIVLAGLAAPGWSGALPQAVPQSVVSRPDAAVGRAALEKERRAATVVSESRMVATVRQLVAFGTRMYGTPSNREAANWLAAAYRDAGLEVVVRQDPPRDWYLPTAWKVNVAAAGSTSAPAALRSAWPGSGSPSGQGSGPLALGVVADAVCLVSGVPTPESIAGCRAVLFEGRASSSGWPVVPHLRGSWSVPAFTVSAAEAAGLRARLGRQEVLTVQYSLVAERGSGSASTVVATLPGKDRTKYLLFCAHGDSDSGGPGANDNGSGVAIILEIARAAAAAIKAGTLPVPEWDLRFATWGGEMSSTREYVRTVKDDTSSLQAVINFDQSGFGSTREALYVEPDDVPVNAAMVRCLRAVLQDHSGHAGFPARAASIKSQGGTDSYVFQNTRSGNGVMYPAVTLYTSAWDRPRAVPVTPGLPPINWYTDEAPGQVTVDGDAYYHSVGDTPAHTTDQEPGNMGWCARVGLVGAWRLMTGR